MPHLVVEHSANLADSMTPGTLLRELHAAIGGTESFVLEEIKGRVYAAADYLVGDGEVPAFVHVTIAVMPGRNLATRKTLSNNVLRAVEHRLSENGVHLPYSLTVEVRELDRESYQKLDLTTS